ncbi:MAG: hypothetical protein EAZ99_19295 [Alphaproteobacteria bacterium]|nr:MAG: hypothetical protein EAZ99_19295 [Alphaproteobacteria bacterium]
MTDTPQTDEPMSVHPMSSGDEDASLITLMAAVAALGWRGLSGPALAARSGLPLVEVYRLAPTRAALICRLINRTDRLVLAGTDPADSSPPRDRLFDVMMRRFDALAPMKPALQALAAKPDPIALAALAAALPLSLGWMLDAARIDRRGPLGLARIAALGRAYAKSAKVWLTDDQPDLPKTMAALDSALKAAGSLLAPSEPKTA